MTTSVFLRNASPTPVPAAYQDGLVIDLFAEPKRSTIVTNFGSFIATVGQPSQTGLDLLLFSSGLYAADKKTPRKLSTDRWTRTFEVSTPVSNLSRWATATPLMSEALSFLTGDQWTFHWRAEQNRAWYVPPVQRVPFDAVCLFSGGLDSLAGAINILDEAKHRRILLLGHYDTGLLLRVQQLLATALAKHYGQDRVQLVQSLVRPAEARSAQQYPLPSGREVTTRSRSLIFFGLGLAAASAQGVVTPLYVPENGFIALNVPLTNARLGSCSTRTTHPYYLHQLQAALSLIGLTHPIINPFEHLAKGEMLTQCHNPSLLRQLAPYSISCAHPNVGRYEQVRYGNCGYCFPCLIRRASLYALRLDDPKHYTHDVCTEESLVNGHSARGRDARAVFAALHNSTLDAHSLRPLLSGPLPDGKKLQDFMRVYQRGLEELRTFFDASVSTSVRQIAGL